MKVTGRTTSPMEEEDSTTLMVISTTENGPMTRLMGMECMFTLMALGMRATG